MKQPLSVTGSGGHARLSLPSAGKGRVHPSPADRGSDLSQNLESDRNRGLAKREAL